MMSSTASAGKYTQAHLGSQPSRTEFVRMLCPSVGGGALRGGGGTRRFTTANMPSGHPLFLRAENIRNVAGG